MGGAQKLKWIGCRGRTFTCLQTQLESSHYTGVRGPRWFQLACAADRKLGGNVEIWLCYFFKQFFFPRNRDARAEAATQTASVCVRGGEGREGGSYQEEYFWGCRSWGVWGLWGRLCECVRESDMVLSDIFQPLNVSCHNTHTQIHTLLIQKR